MENMDKQHLNDDNIVTLTCADCGAFICTMPKDEYLEMIDTDGYHHPTNAFPIIVFEGKTYCFACLDKFYECTECGGLFRLEDGVTYANDLNPYCEDCAQNYLTFCEHCQEYTRNGTHQVFLDHEGDTSEEWCGRCVYNYASRCDECSEYFSNDHVSLYRVGSWGSGTYICGYCLDEEGYVRCENCGEIDRPENMVPFPDGYYCEGCYESRRRVITSYHAYSTNWQFRFLKDENPDLTHLRRQQCFKGIELEIEHGGCDDENAIQITTAMGFPANESNEIRCSKDSSLDYGFELISNPCTSGYHLNGIDWEAGMQRAKELGYRSHDGGHCGLHFHLDRTYFEGAMVDPEAAMIVLLGNNCDWLKLFSRREVYTHCKFKDSCRYTIEGFKNGDYGSHIAHMKEVYRGNGGDSDGSHNVAINFSNYSTIEVRFIRGTLKYSTFVASVQLMDMLAYAAKHFRFEQLSTIDIRWFRRYAKRMGFNEFLTYLDERGIVA